MAHGDPTNIDRANRAAETLRYYQNRVRTDRENDLEVILTDMLTDLMHLARFEKMNWKRIEKNGIRNFQEEVEGDDPGPRAWSPRGWRGVK